MKLTPLLAQYLYTGKRLDLPGIGSFILDPGVTIDPDQGKQGRAATIEGISFEANTNLKDSPDLIEYIASQAGKIRALAAADLDSHLEIARQFINMGKPFLFDGIGSLSKLQNGAFIFSPGMILPEKIKESTIRDRSSDPSQDDVMPDYKSVLYLKKIKRTWKKPAVAMMLTLGLGFTVWVGYKISKRSTDKNVITLSTPDTEIVLSTKTTQLPKDTSAQDTSLIVISNPIKTDSLQQDMYKFVIETAAKERALKRYSFLKNNGFKVEMESYDSTQFKLFFRLQAQPSDTTHILDSLRNFYTPVWSRAFIDY